MIYSDNEIKLSLECCYHKRESQFKKGQTCYMCPFDENGKNCTDILARNALNLVNREDIENAELRLEIAKLHEKIWHVKQGKSKSIYEAKAEAVKDFVEMLCDGRVSNDPVVIAAKSLLKETVGDE